MNAVELARFSAKFTVDDSGCWLWTGARIPEGYGAFKMGGQSQRGAHRVAYEHFVGPIPKGLVIDHLCRVKLCIRPDHLEPVTQTENKRRGTGWAGQNARKTACVHGHEFTPANTGLEPRGRFCRTCARDKSRRRRAAVAA